MTKNNYTEAEVRKAIDMACEESATSIGTYPTHTANEIIEHLKSQPQESKDPLPVKEPLDITPGGWYYSKDQENACTIGTDKRTLFMSNETEVIEGNITIDEVVNNSIAVCRAMNGTYGKGYNPEAMEGLVKEMQGFVDNAIINKQAAENQLTYYKGRFEQALKNAKL